MNQAEILARMYTDRVTVLRNVARKTERKETVFDLVEVYRDVPCSLSRPGGGKLQQGAAVATAAADYSLFVRPEVDILPGDKLAVVRLGKTVQLVAGLAERQVSHNNVPVKLANEVV